MLFKRIPEIPTFHTHLDPLHFLPLHHPAQKLLADAAKTKTMLQSKSGAAFDKAYIDNEVAYHKAVIATVTNTLIPETDNAELKKLLQDAGPIFKAHLQHAEMVQKQFNKK